MIPEDAPPAAPEVESQPDAIVEPDAPTGPFIAPKIAFTEYLSQEFPPGCDESPLSVKLRSLSRPDSFATCRFMRRVRPDGSCLLRAVLFRFLELCIESATPAPLVRVSTLLGTIAPRIAAHLGPSMYTDDFFDVLQEILTGAAEAIAATSDEGARRELIESFCTKDEVQHATYALRLVVACVLLDSPDDYQPFLTDHADVPSFVDAAVLPPDCYMEHVHITALSSGLDIPIRILYSDGSPGDVPSDMTFAPTHADAASDMPAAITLLFRPSHYDLVYLE